MQTPKSFLNTFEGAEKLHKEKDELLLCVMDARGSFYLQTAYVFPARIHFCLDSVDGI